MFGPQVSVIFLPTYECNAKCSYCFETKRPGRMSLQDLSVIFTRMSSFLAGRGVKNVEIYWQGGEVTVLSPAWCVQAGEMINRLMAEHDLDVVHYLQTNLMNYTAQWDEVIFDLFGGSVGSSLDYPNLYRRYRNFSDNRYNELWRRNYEQASSNGVEVSVITVPNRESLARSPSEFHRYFTEEVGLTHFQVNTPYPGGPAACFRNDLLLDAAKLGDFFVGLLDVCLSTDSGVNIAPFRSIIERMTTGFDTRMPCFFSSNCVNGFFCIDPSGEVGQCDCWVSSYPEKNFGNVLNSESLDTIFRSSNRLELAGRISNLIKNSECLNCEYFALCNGGCPVRAMSAQQTPHHKDPYCETYKRVFAAIENRV